MKITLCGLPGSGKTTVGKILAEKTNEPFIDVDALIEKQESLTCREIYQKKGEAYFREVEKEMINSLPHEGIISLGGGAVAYNTFSGISVYLKGDLETLFKRKGLGAYLDPKDPMGSFKTIAAKRIPQYEQASTLSIDTDGLTPEEIALKILSQVPLVQKGILDSDLTLLKSIKASQYVMITDTNIDARPLAKKLGASIFAFSPGEHSKTRKTKEACENYLLSIGALRDTCIIAIGGGVVTDIAGFVAATYCRGVPLVMIPTSLLAMVDASIGGKNGINVPEGKNLIGTIYQPQLTLIDPNWLKTLPETELKNGMVEMIKHGLIANNALFYRMKATILSTLEDNIAIKMKIVAEDEREQGKRRLLNFGHTIGHAIESATNYRISHGRAVAIGILGESYLSMLMGHLPIEDLNQIFEIFTIHKIDLTCNERLDPDQLLHLMQMDKKSVQNVPRFVILEKIGKPLPFDGQYCTAVDETLLKTTVKWICHDVMRCH